MNEYPCGVASVGGPIVVRAPCQQAKRLGANGNIAVTVTPRLGCASGRLPRTRRQPGKRAVTALQAAPLTFHLCAGLPADVTRWGRGRDGGMILLPCSLHDPKNQVQGQCSTEGTQQQSDFDATATNPFAFLVSCLLGCEPSSHTLGLSESITSIEALPRLGTLVFRREEPFETVDSC
ncbi:hypothetical protein [Streptomyces decoyicus]|uniref:hypothetical protein n=1 Tax=Streptomyces decoyicus TaxID=249567 RepID=UPI0033B87883